MKNLKIQKASKLVSLIHSLQRSKQLNVITEDLESKKRALLETTEHYAYSNGLIITVSATRENPLKIFSSKEYALKITGQTEPRAACLIGRIHMLKHYGEKPIDLLWYLLSLDNYYDTAAYREIKIAEFQQYLPRIIENLTAKDFLRELILSSVDDAAALIRKQTKEWGDCDSLIFPHPHPIHIIIKLFEAHLGNLLGEKKYKEVSLLTVKFEELGLCEGLCGPLIYFFDYAAKRGEGINYIKKQIERNRKLELPTRNLRIAMRELVATKPREKPKPLKLIKRVQDERNQIDIESLLLYSNKK